MKLSEQHEGLLAALDEESPARLLEFLKLCHSRANNHVDLAELLQSLPKRLRPRLCSGISSQVMKGLAALHENGPAEEAEQTEEEEWQLAANRAGAPGKEGMVAQTLPYLLVRALSTGKAADVKRCHAIRTALPLLDFDDPSIADLKRLLLRATFSPAFLRPSEGRRFLSFLFTLQPQLVRELTAIVRNQIPSGRKSVLDAYREIVYRAWRDATGACAYEMEHNLIQGLMQAAIVASTPAMNSALRRVLDGLHSQKQHGPVDAMLLRLYEPIIFRAMAAANPAVRRNALLLLIDAFPLQDPDAANEETDELLSRQFSILGSSLGDEAPAVRVAAVLGLCQLLNVYWELVPAATIASFLQRLAGELAFDTAFAGVRAAVAEGLTLLVENPLAQPVLKKLLPHLGPLLQDPALKVRVAFADLLLAIMSVRALHFVDIVALDTLLDVMATDAPPVSERIQRLLLPSYFPDVEEGPARVAALLRTCPEAGKAFCQFLVGRYQPQEGDVRALAKGSGVPMENIVELAVALRDHLLASIPTAHAAPVHAKRGKPTKRTKRKKGKAAAAAEQHEETTEEQEQAEVGGGKPFRHPGYVLV
ncbi:hypothetical protein WJX72_009857 [[Myrmecia] bisecta]|uniref:Uncharacterized protein n=1 Tax=[Myrmecia] bisecta TaxID=41462 RepID=A0AAW1R9S3_9CHLO